MIGSAVRSRYCRQLPQQLLGQSIAPKPPEPHDAHVATWGACGSLQSWTGQGRSPRRVLTWGRGVGPAGGTGSASRCGAGPPKKPTDGEEGSLRNLRGDLEPNLEPNHLQPKSGSAYWAKPSKPKDRITSRTIRCKYAATFTPQHKRNQERIRRLT